MKPLSTLTFSGQMHERVRAHLFPGDGLEAAAILLCSRTPGPRERLLVKAVLLVPHEACTRREPDGLTWPGSAIEEAIDLAEPNGLVMILIHSHPGGFFGFSLADDASDQKTIPSLFHAFGTLHGTAVMVEDGAVRARLYDADLRVRDVELVTVVGDDIDCYWLDGATEWGCASRPVAFTSDMTAEFGRLSAVVIGVSGTGSIVAEQLARLGIGKLVLIDFDRVERKNLNRILNTRQSDALDGHLKVEAFAQAVVSYRGPGVAVPVAQSVTTREAVLAAAQGDILFSCVDSLEARQIADLMASAFLMPLFDVGVVIPTRKVGAGVAIAEVCGRIDYVQPGGSTLQDRGIYTPESVQEEYLRRVTAPPDGRGPNDGYLKGLPEEAPGVITLNMRAASACVNELLARRYLFRLESNGLYARTRFSLAACEEEFEAEGAFTRGPNPDLARGELEPLLGLPSLAVPA